MNDPIPSNQPAPPDLMRIARATRFAFACVALGFFYLTLDSWLSISKFERIYTDMLGENERLPTITTFVFRTKTVVLALIICNAVAAIAVVFIRDIVRSLYGLGILILVSIVEYVVLWHAKIAPLIKIIEKMQSPV